MSDLSKWNLPRLEELRAADPDASPATIRERFVDELFDVFGDVKFHTDEDEPFIRACVELILSTLVLPD
jgi:hypothetical protein